MKTDEQCKSCEKKDGEVNHPHGMIFVGWGHGWQPCPMCGGSGKKPVMRPEYIIMTRVAGQEVWQREASSEAFTFRADAEEAMDRLESVNADGARLFEYKVVERWP